MDRDMFFRLVAIVVALPVFYLLVYILYRVITEVNLYVNIFLGTGLMVTLALYLLKRDGRNRAVSPLSGDLNQIYDRLYQSFSDEGLHIEEYEPLGGRQLNAFLDHPPRSRFLFVGLFLLLAGIFPGIFWFVYGPDKFSITLIADKGFSEYIFESNSRRASKAWGKINLKLTLEMLKHDLLPENLETTIGII